MAKLEILTAPHPTLKKISDPVAKIDSTVLKLVDDLIETMFADDAAGLAAPQVGVNKRLFVFDLSYKFPEQFPDTFVIINPEIYWRSEEMYMAQEGCMSLPGLYFDVERHQSISVRYQDRDGKQHDITCDGLLAHVFQHENDHLDGILSIDRISKLKRQMYLRKLDKINQQLEPA